MLSPATLNRVSNSYRRGYSDGYFGRESANPCDPHITKPFGNFDYQQGYRAGANDAKWEEEQ